MSIILTIFGHSSIHITAFDWPTNNAYETEVFGFDMTFEYLLAA